MNWFQKFVTNPNVHAVGAAFMNSAQPIAVTSGHPEIAVAMAALGTVMGFQSAGTPENPVMVPVAPAAPAAPPAAAPAGSMHGIDYVALAAALVEAMNAPKK